jgi:hypothetical protein
MKHLLAVIALSCAGCAIDQKDASDETYKPPEYRTGSNLPTRGGSHASPATVSTTDAQDLRNSLPPQIVPNRGN